MDGNDWRTQIQDDPRQRIVSKIMDILKKYLPISGSEGLVELRKIAVRFEEQIYTVATSQSDYLWKISLMMLKMEIKSQNTGGVTSMPPNSAGGTKYAPDLASIDSTAQTGNTNAADWQEEVYQKIKSMKDMYYPELVDMYHKICHKLQHESNLQHPKEQLEKVKKMKMILEHLLAFLQVTKNAVTQNHREKLHSYAKNIVSTLQSSRPKKLPVQQGLQQIQPPPLLSMQQQCPETQVPHQVDNRMNPLVPGLNLQNVDLVQPTSVTTSIHSTAQIGDTNAADSQEEVYQKIKSMKDMYYPELVDMYHKICHKLQHESTLQHPKEQLEKVKKMKMMLERLLAFLQVTKNAVTQNHREKLHSYAKNIVSFLQSSRPKKLPVQQGLQQIQPCHPLSMHQQFPQTQVPHQVGNRTNPSAATPGLSASPLLAESTSLDGNQGAASISGKVTSADQVLERLITAVKTISPKALSASVSDIGSVISMIDRIAGPSNGSTAVVGENFVTLTNCHLQARNITHDGSSATKKMRRDTSAMPLNIMSSAGSVHDSFKHVNGLGISDLESTATPRTKRPRVEANHALLEEIREINQRLIDTVVEISDEGVDPTSAAAAAEGGEGMIVKCSFNAVSLSPNLKTQYASAQMSPIVPLRLLVPTNYPNCSPMLLDKCPVELSKEYEDLSAKARSIFNISLRSLSQPMSLGEMVKTWDACARAVVADLAQKSGGDMFSSRYGTWENCPSAA